jgi:hypothetical protein
MRFVAPTALQLTLVAAGVIFSTRLAAEFREPAAIAVGDSSGQTVSISELPEVVSPDAEPATTRPGFTPPSAEPSSEESTQLPQAKPPADPVTVQRAAADDDEPRKRKKDKGVGKDKDNDDDDDDDGDDD